jgi:hypothetical protein
MQPDQSATIKLTPAQFMLLAGLAKQPHYVAAHFAPHIKLVALGFVEEREGRYSTVSYVTDAGKAALAHAPGDRR